MISSIRRFSEKSSKSLWQIVMSVSIHSPLIKMLTFMPVHYQTLKHYNPDIVFSHDIWTLALASKISDDCRAPLIFDSHELELHRNPPMGYLQKVQVRWIERRYLRKCAHITTVCSSIADILKSDYSVKRVSLLFNSPRLKSRGTHRRWARRKSGHVRLHARCSRDDFLLVYVGLITVNRGIELALEALVLVPTEVKLVLVGPGNLDMKRNLQSYAKKIGVADRFKILDAVDPNYVYRYIRTADAAIIPPLPVVLSYEVMLPNKLFESAFSGIPIISADLTEISRMVDRYDLGRTYVADDKISCANAILDVMKNYDAYVRKAEAVEVFRNKYSWEAQEPEFVRIVDELVVGEEV